MKKNLILLTTIFSFLATLQSAEASAFSIKSSDIKPNSTIGDNHVFDGFGCTGKNISPQISWSNAPKDTKSFALTVYDPDAPTGSGWWHWAVINIPATQNQLLADFGKENKFQLKDGILQIRNDFGNYKFGGPCPPKGDKPHRYIFTIHALKVEKLDVKEDATAALAGFFINQNTIAKTSFTAKFGR